MPAEPSIPPAAETTPADGSADPAAREPVIEKPARSRNPLSWLRGLSFRAQMILVLVVGALALLVFSPKPQNAPASRAQPDTAAVTAASESVREEQPAPVAQRFAETTPSPETLQKLGSRNVQADPNELGNDRSAPSAIAAFFRPPPPDASAPVVSLDDEERAAGMPYVGPIRRKAPIEVIGVFGTPENMRRPAESAVGPAASGSGSQGPRVSWGPRDLAGNVNRPPPSASPTVASASEAQPSQGVDAARFAPFGRLIKCRLVNTLDSLVPVNTPVVALVTEPVYWNGKEIIPVNSEVFGYVGAEAQIDARGVGRLFDSGTWALVLPAQRSGKNGREWILRGRALARREAVTEGNGRVKAWEVDDMAPGFIGNTISTRDKEELKLFAASFLGAAAKAAGEIAQTRTILPGEAGQNGITQAEPTARNAIAGAVGSGIEAALSRTVERIEEEIKKRGFYVRVPAGHEFYLFVEQTLDPAKAGVGLLSADPAPGTILNKGGERSE